jgi:hypothetical protein
MDLVRAVRVVVRPDKREEYLDRWQRFAGAAEEFGARVRLCEDLVLPGRFLELIDFEASQETMSKLEDARRAAELRSSCVRREGDDLIYRRIERDE